MSDRPARRPRAHPDRIADAEQLGILREAGHGWLLDVLADAKVYLPNGRLNVDRAARAAGLSWHTFDRRLAAARALIQGDG